VIFCPFFVCNYNPDSYTLAANFIVKQKYKFNFMSKSNFFFFFWTVVLGPFEYFVLNLPFEVVVLIRSIAFGTNRFYYLYWFERKFWPKEMLLPGRIARMVSMKFFVNLSNFIILGILAYLVKEVYTIPIHLTLMGFAKKVMYVTCFAVVLTPPYERLLKILGYEEEDEIVVDLASDI